MSFPYRFENQVTNQFWYGYYDKFKLVINRDTGYFNASKLCADYDKRFGNWFRDKNSQCLLEHYDTKYGNASVSFVKAGINEFTTIITGSYVRPRLLMNIISWLSLDFYDDLYDTLGNLNAKVLKQEETLTKQQQAFLNETTTVLMQRQRAIKERHEVLIEIKEKNSALVKQEDRINELKSDLVEKDNELEVMKHRFEAVREDISPKAKTISKRNTFCLICKNDMDDPYPYYAIRTQKGNLRKRVKRLEKRYPDLSRVMTLDYSPNSVNLFVRIKETLPIDVKRNDIQLRGSYTLIQFSNGIRQLSVAPSISDEVVSTSN